jgi:hypothetical protein
MVGPNTIKRRGAEDLTLWCVTVLDPATGWFEMKEGSIATHGQQKSFLTETQKSWVILPPWCPTTMDLNAVAQQREIHKPIQFSNKDIKPLEISLEPLIYKTMKTMIWKILGQEYYVQQ